ncbi:MAG TPA: IPTL-CTERM sorting domain-containing protein [Candidatus Acidoferrales bacterium]|jgi:streptogramin lyase|nr:IPTL-CTERM sorting domain-containing protein [Candidatus Acidoferrales bacterium]
MMAIEIRRCLTQLRTVGLLLVLCSTGSAQFVITEFSGVSAPFGITAGPDGALWFTESFADRIGRITTAGVITEYSTGITPGSTPDGIAAGPDGALWFTDRSSFVGPGFGPGALGRITTAGVITEYSTGLSAGSDPFEIAAGPDGALWFTDRAGQIGRITTAGVITEYSTGLSAGSTPGGIAAGPDGAMWFAESTGNRIGRITTANTQPGTQGIPTLSQWGVLLLAVLLASAGALELHRRIWRAGASIPGR